MGQRRADNNPPLPILILDFVVEGEDLKDDFAPVEGDLLAFGVCPNSPSLAIFFGPGSLGGCPILEDDTFAAAYHLVEDVLGTIY